VIEQAVQAVENGDLSEELQQQAEHEAHKLAGALGTFGIPDGSRWAEAIETFFQTNPSIDNAQMLRQWMSNLYQALDLPVTIAPHPDQYQLLLLVVSRNSQLTEPLIKEAALWNLQVEVVFDTAFEGTATYKPDIVLLDLDSMPSSKAGLNLLPKLAEQSAPVFVLSERDCFSDRLQVARHGGQSFLLKSMAITQILEAVVQKVQQLRAEVKILMVDDDAHVLNATQRLLASVGLRLTTLDTPQRFWDSLLEYSPDLIILDVEMPDLSGIELCQVLRSDPRWQTLPVLFLTVHTDAETAHRMFMAGATGCVAKLTIQS
jgi:DNA-binding response OmpR family regulator